MEYCKLAAHLRRKGDREKAFQDRSRRMATQFGDCFIHNQKKKCAKISSMAMLEILANLMVVVVVVVVLVVLKLI